MSTENTHFMDSWGTYGIQISRFIDQASFRASICKDLLFQGFFVGERGDRPLDRRGPFDETAFGIALGTLINFRPHSYIQIWSPRAGLRGVTAGWHGYVPIRLNESLQDVVDQLYNVRVHFGPVSPCGLPWEIARIEDTGIRRTAVRAYEQARL